MVGARGAGRSQAAGRGRGAKMVNLLFYHAGAVSPERLGPAGETVAGDRLAHFRGEPQVIVAVVDRVEARAQDFVDPLQMMELSAGEMPARVAAAVVVERAGVAAMNRVADL